MSVETTLFRDDSASGVGRHAMNDWRRGRRRRKGRRRDLERRGRETGVELDPEFMTPEERSLFEARERAEHKVEITGKLFRFAIIALPLLIFLPPIGIVVILVWAWRHGREAYELAIEPRIRERFLREEVEKRVHARLARERQSLEGVHARSMEHLSASIAHEIRNPITAAKSLVQQMEEDPAADRNVEYARVALEELSRVERSVSHLLRYARDEELRRTSIRLADVVDSAVESFRERAARGSIDLVCELDGEGRMEGDAEKLRRAVINLVGNALDAIEGSGRPGGRIEVRMGQNLAGSDLWLRVSDDGPGISPAAREQLFTPFQTSKESGTGLGLPITKKLIEAHGGSIEVDSEPGAGTVFVLTFPSPHGDPRDVEATR